MITAGELNNLVTLMKPVVTEGDFAETEKVWKDEEEDREQTAEGGDWSFDEFILIEHQNLDNSEPEITEVSGSTDGVLGSGDYDVVQNDDEQWGIEIDDENVTTEDQDITIKYEQKPYAQVWANMQNLRGEEYFAARAGESEATGKIKIRYRDDVTADMKLKYNGRIFDIESFFDPYEERKELQLIVKEQL